MANRRLIYYSISELQSEFMAAALTQRQFVAAQSAQHAVLFALSFDEQGALMKHLAFALLTTALSTAALADTVKLHDPWTRATAPSAPAAGAFMTLTADADMRLVGAESAASKVVELHTMKIDNGVMIMRQVLEIPLPKGKAVELKPGGLHIMLIGLNAPLKSGEKVEMTLRVKDSQGKEQRIPVTAEIRSPGKAMPMQHQH